MMRLEAQATSAQLTMLRYQLSPHFLFNTLNSISTLVLLKQTEQANAMLSRLSSFLRFTLINEAAAKVPLTQEIETLKLYLDIEKMRFEERLRTFFNIEPAVENALVPSLLLQPLVENAIKYAVTPKKRGRISRLPLNSSAKGFASPFPTPARACSRVSKTTPCPQGSAWRTRASGFPGPMEMTSVSNFM